ncbi:hypothetical protein M9435_006124 [Picochlorum sp. BPE23]|nr:hypothetical protein M9435_006124 [Picochlorum sp. BPE23]
MASRFFRSSIGWGLSALCAYATCDATADAIMYLKTKQWIDDAIKKRPDFIQTLSASATVDTEGGKEPQTSLQLGPWYDSSVTFSHQGMIATITMPCRGDTQASDITVKAIRKGGLRWTLMYNIVDGSWDVVMMDALVGMRGGGKLFSTSLLDPDATQHVSGESLSVSTTTTTTQ